MYDEYQELTIPLPKPPSLNAFYSGKHWTNRFNEKSSFGKKVRETLLSFDSFHADKISIHLSYNCRFDVDNTIVAIKFLADYFKSNGYIDDDTPKYLTSISSTFNNGLGKDEFLAKVCCWGYKLREDDETATIEAVLYSDGDDSSLNDKSVRAASRPARKSPAKQRASGKAAAKISSGNKGRAKRSKGGD